MSQAIRTSSNATTQPSPNRSDIVVNKASLQSLPVKAFIWGAGIECSILPYLDVDQFKWTQHNQFWKEDFKLAKNDLGIKYLRYAIPLAYTGAAPRWIRLELCG